MVYFHYKNIYTARSFFSFHTTWSHSNKAVHKTVPLICTPQNDKTLIMIKKEIKMQCWKGFLNVNISNGLLFFERYGLITATLCANNFS